MSVGSVGGGGPGPSAHDPEELATQAAIAELDRLSKAEEARAATPPAELPPLPEPTPPAPLREPPVDLRQQQYQYPAPVPPRAYVPAEPQPAPSGGYEPGADLTPIPIVPPLQGYPTGVGYGGPALAQLQGGLGGAYAPQGTPGMPPLPGLPVLGQPVGPAPTARGGGPGVAQGVHTLSDLYACVPDFGNGVHRVRVERLDPKSVHVNGQAVRCAGYLGDFSDRLTDGDFTMMFGGTRYELRIVGPSRQDPSIERCFGKLEMLVSGPPTKLYYDPALEMTMNRYPGQNGGPYGPTMQGAGGYPVPFPYAVPQGPPQQHPQVAMRELDHAFEEKRLLSSTATAQSQEALRIAEKMGDVRSQQIQAALEVAQRRVEQLEGQYMGLMHEKMALVKDLAEARNKTETEAIRDLKDNHEREDRRVREAHLAEVTRLRDDFIREKSQLVDMHKMAFDGESRRHEDERKKLYEDLREERVKARDDLDRRVGDLDRNHTATVLGMKESYEGRLRDKDEAHKETVAKMAESHKETVARLLEGHDRELRMFTKSEEVQRSVITGSHEMKSQLLEREAQRLREDLDHVERELAEARDKLHEDPGTYIQRTADFATNVLGFKKGDDGDKPFDWKDIAAKVMEKAPDVLKSVMDARGQNAQRLAAAQGVRVRELPAGQGGPPSPEEIAHAQQMQANAAMAEHQRRVAMERARHMQEQQRAGLGGPPPPSNGAAATLRRPPGQAPRPPWLADGVPPQGQAPREMSRPPVTGIPNLRQATARPPVSDIPLVGDMPSPISPHQDGVGAVRATEPTRVPQGAETSGLRPAAAQQGPLAPQAQQVAVANGQNGVSVAHAPPPVAAATEAGAAPGQQQIEEFFKSLEDGIKNSQLVPPEAFAEGLVSQLGLERARTWLGQFDGDKLIATLEEISEQHKPLKDSIVLTRDGRAYTKAVFAAAKAMVGL